MSGITPPWRRIRRRILSDRVDELFRRRIRRVATTERVQRSRRHVVVRRHALQLDWQLFGRTRVERSARLARVQPLLEVLGARFREVVVDIGAGDALRPWAPAERGGRRDCHLVLVPLSEVVRSVDCEIVRLEHRKGEAAGRVLLDCLALELALALFDPAVVTVQAGRGTSAPSQLAQGAIESGNG